METLLNSQGLLILPVQMFSHQYRRAIGVTLGGVPLALQDLLLEDKISSCPPTKSIARSAPTHALKSAPKSIPKPVVEGIRLNCGNIFLSFVAAPAKKALVRSGDTTRAKISVAKLDSKDVAVMHESDLFDWTTAAAAPPAPRLAPRPKPPPPFAPTSPPLSTTRKPANARRPEWKDDF